MTIVDEDLITLTQASEVTTAIGTKLSRRQIHHLCTQGKLVAQKVGTVWLVSRKSVERYKPEETGFAAVWKKRKANELNATLQAEIAQAIVVAKKAKKDKVSISKETKTERGGSILDLMDAAEAKEGAAQPKVEKGGSILDLMDADEAKGEPVSTR